MSTPLGAGYVLTAQDIRGAIAAYSRQALQFNESFAAAATWLGQRNVVPSGATITELEQAFLDDYTARNASDPDNAANAHADYLQAVAWLQALTRDLLYATTQAGQNGVGTTAVTDGTASGFTATTVTVEPGQKCYVTGDPTLQSLHDGVGESLVPAINAAAPPQF